MEEEEEEEASGEEEEIVLSESEEEDEEKNEEDEEKDRSTVQRLFKYLYNNPDKGDDDARYCILTRPTYVDDEHRILKTGTAGARYFFMLAGPDGATWEAHLLNEDGTESEDFEFSYSDETDFEGSEYEGEGAVNKVSHGIARKKPYIIQVNCKRSWTGTDKDAETDEFGVATGSYPWDDEEDSKGQDINHFDKWSKNEQEELLEKLKPANYFDYKTEWGKDNQEKERLIQTRLYITVSLTDGTKYNLKINPSYSNNNEADFEKNSLLYKDARRYAGEDEFVWIRQVPAQYNWNYETLANDEKTIDGETYYWKVNPYWK